MIFLYNPSPVVPHLHVIKEHIYTALIADVNKNSGSKNKPKLEANTQTHTSFQPNSFSFVYHSSDSIAL